MTADLIEYLYRRDNDLIPVPRGIFSGDALVCYKEVNSSREPQWRWYRGHIRVDNPMRQTGTATFLTHYGGKEEIEFSFFEDEAVPERTEDQSINPGDYIDNHPDAAVVYVQDTRTLVQTKWLYPGKRTLFEFCAAVNEYNRRHGLPSNLVAPLNLRGRSLREIGVIEAAQEARTTVDQPISGQGVHIIYTSVAPRQGSETLPAN